MQGTDPSNRKAPEAAEAATRSFLNRLDDFWLILEIAVVLVLVLIGIGYWLTAT